MNGMINIITKSAKDTQGALLSGSAGTKEDGGTARFGGKVGDKLHYRGYAKSFQIDDGALPSGDRGNDDTRQVRTGFRIDAEPTGRDLFTLSGDLYKQDYGSTIPQPITAPPYLFVSDDRGKSIGGNVLGRWSRRFSEVSSAALQVYYDRFEKSEQGIGLKTDVADADFQHDFEPFAANHVIWGVGYHYTRVSVEDSPFFRTTSNYRKDSQLGGFIQDEISLIEDELRLTIGSKVEHNDSTGAEVQPSARILWSPTMRQSAWAGVSRAVRLPFIAEEEVDMTYAVEPPFTPENPGALPVEIRFLGNPGIVAEDVLSFEVGYRAQPSDRLSLDTTAF